MILTLKQPDIEAAIKLYVARQGIDLTNREVNVTFSAGRGMRNFISTVEISEVDIPLLFDQTEEEEAAQSTRPVLSVVQDQAATEDDPAIPTDSTDTVIELTVDPDKAKEDTLTDYKAQPEEGKANSLFS